MILLLSQYYSEPSTDKVIDWLEFLGAKWCRLNGLDFLRHSKINSDNNFKLELEKLNGNHINVVWFRRWLSIKGLDNITPKVKDESDDKFIAQIKQFQRDEHLAFLDFIFYSLDQDIIRFNEMESKEINKLIVLKKAKELGLNIPATLITTKKFDFDEFKKSYDLITKPISNRTGFTVDEKLYKGYTSEIKEIPEEIGNHFFLSKFQKKIKKKFEIRSFYIEEKIYSMAIFSQNDDTTKVDFRNYNRKTPNRTVAYKLPDDIETKLIKLAKLFNLNAASYDLIKDENNNFVFLEVNPGGQFGMVSYPCNYNLEKIIAEELIKKDEENTFRKN